MRQILYHYTNRVGYDGIQRDRKIVKSANRRIAHFGGGVYFTSLPPDSDKNNIARNNYDYCGPAKLRNGYLDYYVKVIFSSYDYYLEESDAGTRDIHLYKKDFINLDGYIHSFGEV